MTEYLFSYGTLQPGLAPADIEPIVRMFKPVGRAHIHGLLYDFGEYPGAVLGSNGKVWGQVFELPSNADVLGRLDDYEEFHPDNIDASQFVRKKCKAVLESGEAIEAWVYVYNRDVSSAALIPNGEFVKSRD
ncbi:MAG TPA: gamma-glutamylcyclotransferase family protein [Terriglobales bacterium]|jgi:gamma-glutamylcyclotransferase (GGCT)/AIG2-like uncharacterized protein YtfP|nr:gamma-glutamylcyclotransferase family protein [Terriglobales bacterium]